MTQWKKLALLTGIAVIVGTITTGVVHAHWLGYDSVDGCEIRWEDETKYDSARIAAQDAWEALKGDDDCVDLEPDAWHTVADLEWRDVDLSNVDWVGQYDAGPGADHINLNVHYMDQSDWTACGDENVTMHELGHALGLAHWNTTVQVMRRFIHPGPGGFTCALGNHDISDYEHLWGAS